MTADSNDPRGQPAGFRSYHVGPYQVVVMGAGAPFEAAVNDGAGDSIFTGTLPEADRFARQGADALDAVFWWANDAGRQVGGTFATRDAAVGHMRQKFLKAADGDGLDAAAALVLLGDRAEHVCLWMGPVDDTTDAEPFQVMTLDELTFPS